MSGSFYFFTEMLLIIDFILIIFLDYASKTFVYSYYIVSTIHFTCVFLFFKKKYQLKDLETIDIQKQKVHILS